MNDRPQDLVREQATRLLDRAWSAQGSGLEWPAAAWEAIAEAGFLDLLIPVEAGGVGASRAEAAVFLFAAGSRAVSLPVAETVVARALLASAGMALPSPAEPLALALAADGSAPARIAWPRQCTRVLVIEGRPGDMALLSGKADAAIADCAEMPAGQPSAPVERARLDKTGADGGLAEAAATDFALLTAASIAGAMAETLDIVTGYAQERIQFGRPIGSFQAIQQMAAEMAGLAAASQASVEAASAQDAPAWLSWAAKARAGEAAARVAAIAHQITGAIGYTREFRLHNYTRLLWTWRETAGDEAFWQEALADAALARGAADDYWPFVTSRAPDPAIAKTA